MLAATVVELVLANSPWSRGPRRLGLYVRTAAAQPSRDDGRHRGRVAFLQATKEATPMSASQSFDPNLAPIGVGKDNSPDPDDPDAAPIVDLGESGIEPDPAYKDDVPVGEADADEDARRAGGSR